MRSTTWGGSLAAGSRRIVARRPDNLFDQWAAFAPLCAAARRAVRGKRGQWVPAAFVANLERECLRLEHELRSGAWRPGGYVTFRVRDPKPRFISAAPFRDRVVHHALCAAIEPVFDRSFVAVSYANRLGKGSHRAVDRYEQLRNRHRHVLRADIWRYFPSIDILKRDLRRRIGCIRTLDVLDIIIDGSNPQPPAERYFPGDDLFTPFERRRGLPIGNLTSQLFANVYLDRLDHFATEVLAAPYVRYVDDFALFHDDPALLGAWQDRIARFLAQRRLALHPDKTFVAACSEPATFLGFELHADRRRRLPPDNVRRFRNRLRSLRDRWRAGTVTGMEVAQQVKPGWRSQPCRYGQLRHAIFRGGWFDPKSPPDMGA